MYAIVCVFQFASGDIVVRFLLSDIPCKHSIVLFRNGKTNVMWEERLVRKMIEVDVVEVR